MKSMMQGGTSGSITRSGLTWLPYLNYDSTLMCIPTHRTFFLLFTESLCY